MDEQHKKSRRTLTDFIDENQKLLSSIAIFTALSVFVNQLPGELLKADAGLKMGVRSLSCFLCILATLVYLEVVKNSLSYPDGGIMRWFNMVLFLAFFAFIYVWARTFIFGIVGALLMFLFSLLLVFLLALFALLFSTIMRHTSLLKSQSQKTREQTIPLFVAMGLMVAVIASLKHFLH